MELERRSTYREEDQVVLPPSMFVSQKTLSPKMAPATLRSSSSKLEEGNRTTTMAAPSSFVSSQPSEEVVFGNAFACVASNKQNRPTPVSTSPLTLVNEDRVKLDSIRCRDANGNEVELLYAAVLDGHGGFGKASEFVNENLKKNLIEFLDRQDDSTSLDLPDRLKKGLMFSFEEADRGFYRFVKDEAARANIAAKDTSGATKCCRYFKEDPCTCMNPPVAANEGTTATVVIVTPSHIICANVGDSDAFLVQTVSDDDLTEKGSASPLSNDSALSAIDLDATQRQSASLDMDACHRQSSGGGKRARCESVTSLEMIQLSITDTPVADQRNEDYSRIKEIASRRADLITSHIPKLPVDGILKSVRGDRFNYVAVPGARSLNMVRAFGNLGNKQFVDGTLIECESAIISRPHIQTFKRDSSMVAVVLGSDGLWDNVLNPGLSEILSKHFLDSKVGQRDAAKQCGKDLVQKALKSKRKPDDISVIVFGLT